MSKRLEAAGASKLSRQGEAAVEVPRLKRRKRETKRPKSFRLHPRDLARLEALIERVGEATGRRIAEADLIAGVLFLGEKVTTQRLVAAVKDAAWE